MLEFIILALSIPAGFLIAWLARDELIQGRKYFRILALLSVLIGISSIFFNFYEISFSCAFIAIVSIISLMKSRDKRWTRKRI